jgi:hypothetical protein
LRWFAYWHFSRIRMISWITLASSLSGTRSSHPEHVHHRVKTRRFSGHPERRPHRP